MATRRIVIPGISTPPGPRPANNLRPGNKVVVCPPSGIGGGSGSTIAPDFINLPDTFLLEEGTIYKDGIRFIHNFQHPTGDTQAPVGKNIFIGKNAGNFTTGQNATTGSEGSYRS
jgi:hypothetical protein